MKTILKLLFWNGLLALGMYFTIGHLPALAIGFGGAVLMMFVSCIVIMTSPIATRIQRNTNKFVVDSFTANNKKLTEKSIKRIKEYERNNKPRK